MHYDERALEFVKSRMQRHLDGKVVKPYRCSLCNGIGHNVRRCPNNQLHNDDDDDEEEENFQQEENIQQDFSQQNPSQDI